MENLALRITVEKDFDAVWSYCSNATVTKYLTWDPYTSKAEFSEFFNEKMLNASESLFLVITLDDVVIGTSHIIERSESTLQIGYGILPEYWNRGLGGKILGLIERYIEEHWAGRSWTILLEFHKDNIAMQKIAVKRGYLFVKTLDQQRLRFERLLVTHADGNLLQWLQDNESVESILLLGSRRRNKYSDLDVLIIVYEESTIEEVLHDIVELESVTLVHKPSSVHVFVKDDRGRVYDIYVLSSACFHAIHNIGDVLLDKSGFVSRLVTRDQQTDISRLIFTFVSLTERFLDKLSVNKYVQCTRCLADIRNKAIIPLGVYFKVIEATSIIDVKWNDTDCVFHTAYLATFVPPNRPELLKASKELLAVMGFLTSAYTGYGEKYRQLEKYVLGL